MSLSIAGALATAGLTLGFSEGAAAQLYSTARSIQLVAVKAPAVDAMHAVSASVKGSGIDVQLDEDCSIRVAMMDARADTTRLRDAGGALSTLTPRQDLTLFDGRCREAAPRHAYEIVAPGGEASDSVTVRITVLSGHGERQRRWTVYVTRPRGPAP